MKRSKTIWTEQGNNVLETKYYHAVTDVTRFPQHKHKHNKHKSIKQKNCIGELNVKYY